MFSHFFNCPTKLFEEVAKVFLYICIVFLCWTLLWQFLMFSPVILSWRRIRRKCQLFVLEFLINWIFQITEDFTIQQLFFYKIAFSLTNCFPIDFGGIFYRRLLGRYLWQRDASIYIRTTLTLAEKNGKKIESEMSDSDFSVGFLPLQSRKNNWEPFKWG
jgi:hypothetical protein